jgi:hypothetical protein
MDRENIVECSIKLGEKCDPEFMYHFERGTKGQLSNSAKIVKR